MARTSNLQSITGRISVARPTKTLKVFFDEKDLGEAANEAVNGDLITLHPGNFNLPSQLEEFNNQLEIKDELNVVVLPGAEISYSNTDRTAGVINAVDDQVVDLNKFTPIEQNVDVIAKLLNGGTDGQTVRFDASQDQLVYTDGIVIDVNNTLTTVKVNGDFDVTAPNFVNVETQNYTESFDDKTIEFENDILYDGQNDDSRFIVESDVLLKEDLTVRGDRIINNAEEVTTEDNILVLNSTETGSGVTFGSAGIEIDRGSLDPYRFVFRENDDSLYSGFLYHEIEYINLNGSFTTGERIEGQQSGATAVIYSQDTNNDTLKLKNVTDEFKDGEEIVGQDSGTTADIDAYNLIDETIKILRKPDPTNSYGILFWDPNSEEIENSSNLTFNNNKLSLSGELELDSGTSVDTIKTTLSGQASDDSLVTEKAVNDAIISSGGNIDSVIGGNLINVSSNVGNVTVNHDNITTTGDPINSSPYVLQSITLNDGHVTNAVRQSVVTNLIGGIDIDVSSSDGSVTIDHSDTGEADFTPASDSAITQITTDDRGHVEAIAGTELSTEIVPEGSNNLYYTDQRVDQRIQTIKPEGKATFSGDASTKTFQIPHNLPNQPSSWFIEPVSNDASVYSHSTADSTSITVVFDVAPPNGTDNVKFRWMANKPI